jgi:hypothetical protein
MTAMIATHARTLANSTANSGQFTRRFGGRALYDNERLRLTAKFQRRNKP